MIRKKEILDDVDFHKEGEGEPRRRIQVFSFLQFIASIISLLGLLICVFDIAIKGGINWYGRNEVLNFWIPTFLVAMSFSFLFSLLRPLFKEEMVWYGTIGRTVFLGLVLVLLLLFLLIYYEVGFFK